MTFRKDINGLRAIAVLAVLLYHFRISGFGGAFIGVDIFFVISGYLMTGIIFSKLAVDKFSLLNFYIHRARRIIPALAVLCVAVWLFGLLYLPTIDYRELLYTIQNAILFVSNIGFANQVSYFDTPSQENWLLHTWSLSVEWQFYLIYPIVLILLRKFLSLRSIKYIILVLAIVSLVLCIVQTWFSPVKAFFLLPFRSWEMLAGGIVFLFPLKLNNNTYAKLIQYLGFVAIALSIVFINTSMPWPGYLAIVPVVGTMLIIWVNQHSFILNNPVSQWLGKISYSIYLWHWPFAVALTINGSINEWQYVVYSFLITLLLAFLSYFFIETRVKINKTKVVQIICYLLIIIFVVALSSITRHLLRDYPKLRANIMSKDFYKIDSISAEKYLSIARYCLVSHDMKQFPECKAGEGEPSLIIMGDSHAAAIYPAIKKVNPKATLLWTHSACLMVEGVHYINNMQPGCVNLFKQKKALLETQYPNVPVLFVNFLTSYISEKNVGNIYFTKPTTSLNDLQQQFREAYIHSVCEIAKHRPVYVLKPIPVAGTNIPKHMALSLVLHGSTVEVTNPISDYYKNNDFILETIELAKKQCNIQILDTLPYFCADNKTCITTENGYPLYFDNNHISQYASERLAPIFEPIFKHKP